jgi:hypothetical protein
MVKVRIYSEVSFEVDMDIEGINADSRDYDVQQHRKEIYDYLKDKLDAAFGDSQDLTLHYFEFSLAKD